MSIDDVKKLRGRPRVDAVRVGVRFSPTEIEAIDTVGGKKRRARTVRTIVAKALLGQDAAQDKA